MIAIPLNPPEFNSNLCTIDEFLESLNPAYAKTMYPDPNDKRPIWKFNIEEKLTIFPEYGQTLHCVIKQQTRRRWRSFAPIFKTPNGCIMEEINPPYTARFNKICEGRSDCPLKPELVIGSTRFYHPPNFVEDEDFDDDDEDFDEDDEDFLPDHSQKPILPIIVTETPITAPLVPFLNDCCVKGGEVDNSDLKAQYRQWCIDNTKEEISPKNFKMIMKTLGFTQKNNPERTWENIQLSFN